MSSVAFLVTELQSLASETRRKHADVREAADKAVAILRNLPDQSSSRLSEDVTRSEELLRPVFMGCATKNTKVIAISLGSLQRLIALQAVPQSAVPAIVTTMNECMSQGVDIQLRILQTLLSLITNFPTIHGQLLGDALLLCFKMQESRIAVVSSTAAATMRQLVMFIIDKVVDEDRRESLPPNQFTEIVLPDGAHKSLGPSALDAYSVVEDLCLLANSEKPHFLKLGSLPKTFALELIESVLTNYHDLFRQHNELLVLLQHHLSPLLLKLMSDRPLFPLTLRATRVVFILLKQFSTEFITEAEVFLSLLIKIIGGESESGSSDGSPRPLWMRVLAMEIIRGLCNDAELMRRVWERYDSQKDGTKLFGSLISVLKRLVTEKPALLGVSTQMFGVGVSSHHADQGSSAGTGGYGFDVATVASIVANAATTVVGKMGVEHGLDLAGSSMKLQCIDQLDKADAPPVPEAYIYLLGLQCLVSISEGFASLTLPLFNSIVVQRSRAAGETTIKAPSALDVSALPEDQPSTQVLRSVYGMIDNGWPGLLAALSFLIATNLSDELFGDVLQSYQNLANVAGMLGLTTPRDAFLTSLGKFAIPSRVVSSLEAYVEPPTPRSAMQEGFGSLTGGPQQPPGLSERNMACLKVLIASALFLAGSLGASWYNVFEALQNAEYVLTAKGQKPIATKRPGSAGPTASRSVSSSGGVQPASNVLSTPRHVLLSDVDNESIQRAIQRLFDSSKNLEDSAFHDFVSALCKLSAEMIEMQSDTGTSMVEVESAESIPTTLSASASIESAHRRRVSGIHLPKALRTGDFSINKLGSISRTNILRFTARSPDIAWNVVMGHLSAVLRNRVAPHPIRLQAARTLDDVLLIVPRNIGSLEERKKAVQRLMLDVLAEQVAPDPVSGNTTTVVEIRKMGLETLHQILQFAGHTLLVGWEVIFEMLGSACEPMPVSTRASIPESAASSPIGSPQPTKLPPLQYSVVPDKGSAVLVRIAFQSLTLVCDSLSTLSVDHLRLCISTIGQFGRQADTNISLTAAGSLLWGVSDAIQTRRKNAENEEEYNALWMLLLLEMLGLCTDPRSEVRVGAIQTLFRTLQLYGASLSLETWDEVLWKVMFPLLESLTDAMKQLAVTAVPTSPITTVPSVDLVKAWDESKTLSLQSIGSIFNDFVISKFIRLDSFERVWDTFITHIQISFMFDSAASSTAALKCLEKAVRAIIPASVEVAEKVKSSWHRAWTACDDMGQLVLRRTRPPPPSQTMGIAGPLPFDQDSLLAFVDVLRATRALSREKEGHEWEIEQLMRLMAILKGVLTYPDSPNYRPDIDDLTPVQAAVLETINDIDLTVAGAPSLVLRDLSEILTLPYLGAFDVHTVPSDPSRPQRDSRFSKRVTYIALTKKVMPMLRDVFVRFKDADVIYTDGTLEVIFSAYAVPIKLKYECPAPSKFGNDTPLWKTATTSFLLILRESTQKLRAAGTEIPDERIESIWRHIIDAFRGGILADCRCLDSMSLEEQEAEEMFDISLIAALETDVVPYVGDARVSDQIIIQLAKMLHRGSLLHVSDDGSILDDHSSSPRSVSLSTVSSTAVEYPGSTLSLPVTSRERFSYWCLDLLLLICSDDVKDEEPLRRRIAALSLPTLLHRCRTTLSSYLADEALRGSYPFPRSREEELVYILKKLQTLRLWPGSLWAALSPSPSAVCSKQPAVEGDLSPPQLLQEATRRSILAHLFHLYTPLCQIAALPRKPPIAWAPVFQVNGTHHHVAAPNPKGDSSPSVPEQPQHKVGSGPGKTSSFVATNATSGELEELDARSVASACLAEIGKELGVATSA